MVKKEKKRESNSLSLIFTMKKLIMPVIIIMILLALAFSIYAAQPPPFTQTAEGDTLTIQHPPIYIYKQNEVMHLFFHVFNSTGFIQIGSEVDCTMDIYDDTGNEIIGVNLIPVDSDYNYNFTNTSRLGSYGWIVWCNTTDEAGFASSYFEITSSGLEEPEGSRTLFVIIILLPMLLGLFFLIGAATMGQDHNIIKITLFLLSIPMFFISTHWAMLSIVKFYNFPELQNAIGVSVYIIGSIFTVLIIYFLIYLFFKIIKKIKEDKEKDMEY